MGGKQWTILTISGYDPLNILGPASRPQKHKQNPGRVTTDTHHTLNDSQIWTKPYKYTHMLIMNVSGRDDLEAKTITILGFTKAFNSENQKEIKGLQRSKVFSVALALTDS